MISIKKLPVLVTFAICSLSVYGEGWDSPVGNPVQTQEKGMTLTIMINSNSQIQMQDVPTTGYLEVYSILGVKVTSANLKNCLDGYSLDLPKGIYILKAGKVAKKVLVR